MRKFYVKKEDLNDEELRTGKVSYGRIVDRYINNLVLCNNIENVDESVLYNSNGIYDDENDSYTEIYQYYLCDLDDYTKEQLEKWGFLFSYSDMLDLDVLLVDHFGTNWNYVMTDVEWTEKFEECE